MIDVPPSPNVPQTPGVPKTPAVSENPKLPETVALPEMLAILTQSFAKTAEDILPWFVERMPSTYFLTTSPGQQLNHLRAIVAARASGLPVDLTLKHEDGTMTFFRERDYPGLLAEFLDQLPADSLLQSASVHSASDGTLVLDIFRFGEAPRMDPADAVAMDRMGAIVAYAKSNHPRVEVAGLEAHLMRASKTYVLSVSPLRAMSHYLLCQKVDKSDDTAVSFARESGRKDRVRINIAAGHARPQRVFQRICRHLGHRNVDIRRAYLDVFSDGNDDTTSVLGLVVTDDGRLTEGSAGLTSLQGELERLRWVDKSTLKLAYAQPQLHLVDAEVIVALTHLAHARLTREDRFAYARSRMLQTVRRQPDLCDALAGEFRLRFSPELAAGRADDSDARRDARMKKLRAQINSLITDQSGRRGMHQMLNNIDAIVRTNVAVPGRYGLAFRISPQLIAREESDCPFGVFFIHGRGFDGFHVRFRDIARGGVRVVRPRSLEQHAVETRCIFDEAYDLAFAQQLKNKDIPEGGSKGVVLVHPNEPIGAGAKAFADGLLDLITPDPETTKYVVNSDGPAEFIYLGPDENISPELINWIVARAHRRNYPMADAFMSSKPGAGINHKEYGVTSEGVTVFLEEALLAVGINPRTDKFSVKLTGGPDGDVAGNEIRILFREFPDTARVVGIADGSGSASDPDGLDRTELMRLVTDSLPIVEFSAAALGPRGAANGLDSPDGVRARNSLHNKIVADAFIPAGGRPSTIHDGNWEEYLTDGVPSSKVIVEGANLFVTPTAREALSREAGVLVVKDSSANKCGVICSSFEIAACMLLSPAQVLEMKEVLVSQVLTRLRTLARLEARFLFKERLRRPGTSLPKLSVALSRAVGRAHDTLLAGFVRQGASALPLLDRVTKKHLPPVVLEAVDGDVSRLPVAYRRGIAAAYIATRIVYREGLDYLGPLEGEALVAHAIAYLDAEKEVARLAASARASGGNDGETIAALLEVGGVRAHLQTK